MSITQNIIRTVLLYVVVLAGLIMLVFFPREADIAVSGKAMTIDYGYTFSWGQYKENISGWLTHIRENGSLGDTRYNNVTVEDELKRYFPNSLKIIVLAFVLSIFVGIAKGIFDYNSAKTKKNILGNGTTWLFQSIPDFLIVIVIQWLVIFMFPSVKILSQANWYSFVLPGILVAIYPMMYVSRITSASIASQEGLPYIQVARAKGFTKRRVMYKHILKNSIGTILGHITSLMIYILSNLLIVEYLFGYEGIAYRLFVAMGITKAIAFGRGPIYEDALIVGIGICFMLTITLAQVIGYLAKKQLKLQ
ncbi:ABC transporter permease [Bacillus luteolus]|uniref:ABC transporter permease n=1 Tax=Litchfieldia luteola TaxID=682179 RepID=A0ABR9QLJ1_9BACI|nr:ABC transporter permease [Cytobacillus luteolus]MBE4909358.1 ABC transporter permease [Cytobacillus luteolus]